MTNETDTDTLRRRIAEALHITVERTDFDDGYGMWEFKKNDVYLGAVVGDTFDPIPTAEDAWKQAWDSDPECGSTPIPDWPEDTAAALALCLEIARRLHVTVEIVLYPDGSYGASIRENGIGDEAPTDATLSETLSLLALAALQAGVKP